MCPFPGIRAHGITHGSLEHSSIKCMLESFTLFVTPWAPGGLWVAELLLPLRYGQVAAIFLCLYGIFRIVMEFFRQPDEQLGFIAFGWLTMGQLLSIAILLIGIAFLLWLYRAGIPNSLRRNR